ncbi:hypothetical protein [Streptomyces sp. NPDC127039]|uniref:hypothetical protein n=1 Tax=Streptomyces sp. NPDC127039 TaxID=3347115 RepID=UPI003654FD75
MVLVLQTDAPYWDLLVFEGIDDVDVEAVTVVFGTVEVVARGRRVGAECPDCGRSSDRVHDRYQRKLKDIPLPERDPGERGRPPLPFRLLVVDGGHAERERHLEVAVLAGVDDGGLHAAPPVLVLRVEDPQVDERCGVWLLQPMPQQQPKLLHGCGRGR